MEKIIGDAFVWFLKDSKKTFIFLRRLEISRCLIMSFLLLCVEYYFPMSFGYSVPLMVILIVTKAIFLIDIVRTTIEALNYDKRAFYVSRLLR